MATNVNPVPELRIPDQFLAKKDTRAFFDQIVTIIFQLRQRTGGNNDLVEEAQSLLKEYSWPSVAPNTGTFRAVSKSTNYTMLPFDFVNATNGVTITFPEFPSDGDVIIVRNGDGTNINLDGNGKNMNGESTGIISNKTTAIDFYYFIDSDEWFAA